MSTYNCVFIWWANADSARCCGYSFSLAQSQKLDLNPWAVATRPGTSPGALCFLRRLVSAISVKALPAFEDGNTNWFFGLRFFSSFNSAIVWSANGARCETAIYVLAAGIVHICFLRSNSDQREWRASPDRTAVRLTNRSSVGLTFTGSPIRSSTNSGIIRHGIAGLFYTRTAALGCFGRRCLTPSIGLPALNPWAQLHSITWCMRCLSREAVSALSSI